MMSSDPTTSAGGSSRARRREGAVGAVAPPVLVLSAPWEARPVGVDGPELDRVHRWMHEPHVEAHWGQAWTKEEWSAEVAAQLVGDHSRPFTIWLDGEALAYVEVYRVQADVVAEHWPAEPGDLGLHVAIGERRHTGRGLGRRILRAVSDGLLLADPTCGRIVGDPSVGHPAARRAFAAAGFAHVADVPLPHKQASILVRQRR